MNATIPTWQDFEAAHKCAMRQLAKQLSTEYADVVSESFSMLAEASDRQLCNVGHWVLGAVRKKLFRERMPTLPSWVRAEKTWHRVESLDALTEVEPAAFEDSNDGEEDSDDDLTVYLRQVEQALLCVPASLHPVARAALSGLNEREIARLVRLSRSTVHLHIEQIVCHLKIGRRQAHLFGLGGEDSSHA